MHEQNTDSATEGNARMRATDGHPFGGLSCKHARITGVYELWADTGKVPAPNLVSYCIATRKRVQDCIGAPLLGGYWSWLFQARAAFCATRGIEVRTVFGDELAYEFRDWLRARVEAE